MPRFSLQSLLVIVAVAAVTCWLYFTVCPFGELFAWLLVAASVGFLAYRSENRWLVFASGLMFLIGVLAIPFFLIDGHSVPPSRLARIHSGTTAARVKSLLGSPTTITSSEDGQSWDYAGPTWCHVTIYFHEDGTVVGVDHDH